MGIISLFHILKQYASGAIRRRPLKNYAGQTVAIDGNSFVHAAIKTTITKQEKKCENISTENEKKGETIKETVTETTEKKTNESFYDQMYFKNKIDDSVKKLLETGVKPIFFYDSSFPKEKNMTIRQRQEDKKLEKLRLEILQEENNEQVKKNLKLSPRWNHRRPSSISSDTYKTLRFKYNRDNKDTETLSNERQAQRDTYNIYIPHLIKISKSSSIPCFRPAGEAENNISLYVNNNLAFAAMSSDTDCLAFGAKIFFYNIEEFLVAGDIFEMKIRDILENLKLSYPQFVDFCILLGCDYSTITKPNYSEALVLIRKHINLEKICLQYPNMISIDQICQIPYARSIFYRGCIIFGNKEKNFLVEARNLSEVPKEQKIEAIISKTYLENTPGSSLGKGIKPKSTTNSENPREEKSKEKAKKKSQKPNKEKTKVSKTISDKPKDDSEIPKEELKTISEKPKEKAKGGSKKSSEKPIEESKTISEKPKEVSEKICQPQKENSSKTSEKPKKVKTKVNKPKEASKTSSETLKEESKTISEVQKEVLKNIYEPPKEEKSTKISEKPKKGKKKVVQPNIVSTTIFKTLEENSKTNTETPKYDYENIFETSKENSKIICRTLEEEYKAISETTKDESKSNFEIPKEEFKKIYETPKDDSQKIDEIQVEQCKKICENQKESEKILETPKGEKPNEKEIEDKKLNNYDKGI